MADIARITEVVEPLAQALGFDLVRVKMMGAEAGDGEPALQIMAEDPATGQLVIASKIQPYKVSNLAPAVQRVEDACSACHKEFRDH